MKLGSKILGVVMSGAFAAAASLMGAGAAHAATDPNTCFIQTDSGRYITAVGGGGRTTDVMHTNATVPSTWERVTLVYSGDGSHYGLRTAFGYYVTAVNSDGLSSTNFPTCCTRTLPPCGPGRSSRSSVTAGTLSTWEKFRFTCNV